MHKLNILIHGPESFLSTILELKQYLNFNIIQSKEKYFTSSKETLDGLILYDQDPDQFIADNFTKANCFKILATNQNNNKYQIFDHILKLPTTVKEINDIIETTAVKREFSRNSSIQIKKYFLDKNEKKLSKDNNFIILTEKEIQLLELFLSQRKSISKSVILSKVWRYSSDADTHTVETHIYRLRKKINDKFSDNEFILNNKNGYYL